MRATLPRIGTSSVSRRSRSSCTDQSKYLAQQRQARAEDEAAENRPQPSRAAEPAWSASVGKLAASRTLNRSPLRFRSTLAAIAALCCFDDRSLYCCFSEVVVPLDACELLLDHRRRFDARLVAGDLRLRVRLIAFELLDAASCHFALADELPGRPG